MSTTSWPFGQLAGPFDFSDQATVSSPCASETTLTMHIRRVEVGNGAIMILPALKTSCGGRR
jgi:hypothetical protein